ncbi:MAG: rod shape-determining protein MreD [Prevotella sp.]|nr:rod shape-determining protein MreD [Prevotella sp.]MBQ6201831.1 rod shape-determining protein MreD [Prevotella sp.]
MARLVNRLVMFVVLLVVQVLVLNHVWLLNVATPLLYVYFAITFPRNTEKGEVLGWCFLLGLLIDIFSNTPGLAAGTLTLIGMTQTYLVELFVPRDSVENLEVSAATLGWGKFSMLSGILTLIYCLLFFILEAFNFFDWQLWILRAVCSTVLTLLLMLAIESVRSRK